jgi:hypothetical protein
MTKEVKLLQTGSLPTTLAKYQDNESDSPGAPQIARHRLRPRGEGKRSVQKDI